MSQNEPMYVNMSSSSGPGGSSGSSPFLEHWNAAYLQDAQRGLRADRPGDHSASSQLSAGSHGSQSSAGSGSTSSAKGSFNLEAQWESVVAFKEAQFGGTLPWSRDAGSGVPALLWCEGNASGRGDETRALADRFFRSEFRHFTSPVNFTRWLFEQGASTGEGWAVLAVGWREAKPCGLAIRAVITGNTSGLRYDAKRPPLKMPEGPVAAGEQMTSAVKAIIILPDNDTQAERAYEWIRSEGQNFSASLHVACDLSTMVDLLDQLLLPSSSGYPSDQQLLSLLSEPGTTRISL